MSAICTNYPGGASVIQVAQNIPSRVSLIFATTPASANVKVSIDPELLTIAPFPGVFLSNGTSLVLSKKMHGDIVNQQWWGLINGDLAVFECFDDDIRYDTVQKITGTLTITHDSVMEFLNALRGDGQQCATAKHSLRIFRNQ